MATHSSHKQSTSTRRAASSASKRTADLRLLEELQGGLPIGMLIHAADTLEILRATAPLPGFADDERSPERQAAAHRPEEDYSRLPHVLASLIREVAATGTPRELAEFRHDADRGPPRWWRATLHRVDTDNWGTVVVTLTLELTEQIGARDLLAEQEARQRTLRQAIASVPGPNLVFSLQQVSEAIVPAFPADVATIRLLDADGRLHLIAASGLRSNEIRRLALEPITAPRLEAMTEANQHPLQSLGLRRVQVRWLEAGDTRIGMLTIAARTSRSLAEHDRSLLDAAAAQLGRALATIDRTPRFLRSRSLEMARLAAPEIDSADSRAARVRPRELAILRLYAEGLTTDQIADLLVLSPHTIRTHVRNARRRLGVTSRRQALDAIDALGSERETKTRENEY